MPENVEAQVELWHQERARVKFEEVMMIDLSRLNDEDYMDVRQYAENLAVVCWATKLAVGGGEESEDEEDEEEEEDVMDDGPGGRRRRRRKKLLAVRPEALERIQAFVEDRGYTHHLQGSR